MVAGLRRRNGEVAALSGWSFIAGWRTGDYDFLGFGPSSGPGRTNWVLRKRAGFEGRVARRRATLEVVVFFLRHRATVQATGRRYPAIVRDRFFDRDEAERQNIGAFIWRDWDVGHLAHSHSLKEGLNCGRVDGRDHARSAGWRCGDSLRAHLDFARLAQLRNISRYGMEAVGKRCRGK